MPAACPSRLAFGELQDVVWPEIQKIFLGQASAQEVFDAAKPAVDEILAGRRRLCRRRHVANTCSSEARFKARFPLRIGAACPTMRSVRHVAFTSELPIGKPSGSQAMSAKHRAVWRCRFEAATTIHSIECSLVGLLFVLPVVLGTLILNVLPTFATLGISFTAVRYVDPTGMGGAGQL